MTPSPILVCAVAARPAGGTDPEGAHVLPRSQSGGESWKNLVCACVRCNARKGGRTPTQASMTLIRRPAEPRRNPLISLRLGQERYSTWKAFLDNAYWSVELK